MKIGISKLHVSFGCCPFYGDGSVVNSLIIAAHIVCVDFFVSVLVFCYTKHSVLGLL